MATFEAERSRGISLDALFESNNGEARMKLVRAGELGSEKPGVIDDTGAIRDLSD